MPGVLFVTISGIQIANETLGRLFDGDTLRRCEFRVFSRRFVDEKVRIQIRMLEMCLRQFR